MKINFRDIILLPSMLCLVFLSSYVYGQNTTVKLTTNPPVTSYELTSGTAQQVSSKVEVENAVGGVYMIRIILKRSDGTLFELYHMGLPLVSGTKNTIENVEFRLDPGAFFSSFDKSGDLYAAVTSPNGVESKSSSISVKLKEGSSNPPPAPSPATPIVNNYICCDQLCLPSGAYPSLITQDPFLQLSGPVNNAATVWEYRPDGHKNSGYIVNGNPYAVLPYQSNNTVRYRRLLNATHVPAEETPAWEWVAIGTIPFSTIGWLLSGKNKPEHFETKYASEWITISFVPNLQNMLIPARTYGILTTKSVLGKTIEIRGNQMNESLIPVTFTASEAIRIMPNTVVSRNIRLVANQIAGCNPNARLASREVITPLVDMELAPKQVLSAYPNPANEETAITFSVEKISTVKLFIADSNGAQIATLIDNQLVDPGSYTQTFDTRKLVPGVYLCSLIVDGKSEVKRLVVTEH